MKWFKHESTANMDAKLQEILLDYGLEGYGLYWYCLELIANNVEPEKLTFELEHDCRIIARNTGSTVQKVQEMMSKFVELGLFENTSGMITCLKLAKVSDDYTAKLVRKNPPQTRIDTGARQTPTNSEKNPLDKIRIDKNRIDKNKEKEIKHNELVNHALDHLFNATGRKFRTSTELNARLKDYSLDEVKQVIDYKARQWMGTDMQTYLRPQTLFNANKFESYLNDSMQNVKTTKTNNQSSSIDVLRSIELVNTAGMLTHD